MANENIQSNLFAKGSLFGEMGEAAKVKSSHAEKLKEPDTICCYKSRLVSIENFTRDEVFTGYDEIRLITFSYDFKMLDWLLKKFKYAEVIIGADFLYKKDTSLANAVACYLEQGESVPRRVRKYEDLVRMMQAGNLVIHSSPNIIDHRKMYFLKADDGKTRVIVGSGNASWKAWSSDQLENYVCYDTPEDYDKWVLAFKTAWELSEEIPYEVVGQKETDDPLKTNAFIKKVQETNKAIVLQAPDQEETANTLQFYQYTMDLKSGTEKYIEVLKNSGLRRGKDGLIKIAPKVIQTLSLNMEKAKIRRVTVEKKIEHYPSITIDYDASSMLINDKAVNLSPSADEVKADIESLLTIFQKYDVFVGISPSKQKDIYFKLLNSMFASPFFARIRCEAALINKGTTSLPLYLLVASNNSSTGKSFFIEAVLKMMTGFRDLSGFSAKDTKPVEANIRQHCIKGTPFFVDEIDNMYLSHLKGFIKTTGQACEMAQNDTMPMLILASNDSTDPEMQLRKRMIFLHPDGAIPSDSDQTAWKSAGQSLISRIGSAFYREYMRRMIPKIWELIDRMHTDGKNFPDDWYPDVMPLSSSTLMEMMNDYGFPRPSYFRKLTWKDDFSENAAYLTEDAFQEIKNLYNTNKAAFDITKDTVTIKIGLDPSSAKRMKSWAAVMPVEIMKQPPISTRDGWTVVFNRAALEKKSGIRFKKKFFGWF